MIRLIILLTLFQIRLCANSQSKAILHVFKEELTINSQLNKKSLYVVCRGTRSKSGLIANKFNLGDTNATHIGIGFVQNDELRIFNVTNDNGDRYAFRDDSVRSFIGNSDVYYMSIWKIKVTNRELDRAIEFINIEKRKNIRFDYNFVINNGDSLYCSEFCVRVLEFVNNKKFSFEPTSRKIDYEIVEKVLGRKVLLYYPVDFFDKSKYFIHVRSYLFAN